MTRPSVLILSSNSAFARELNAHWPADPNPPDFTVLEEALFRDDAVSQYDLVIADVSSQKSHSEIRRALAESGKAAILIHAEPSLAVPYSEGATIELPRLEGQWPVLAGLLGREILRRCQAEGRAREAEGLYAAAEAEATLGRYIAEMRHNVNNALTSVLGNAELLMLEPGLPANVLVQADTILNMALRLHEVFQRFSSIEKELSVAARQSGKRNGPKRATASGK
jgi:signal transduction histidine kinase